MKELITIMNINLNIYDLFTFLKVSYFFDMNIYFDTGLLHVRQFICVGYSTTSSLSEIGAYAEPSQIL